MSRKPSISPEAIEKVLMDVALETVMVVARAMEKHDSYTANHQRHVADLASAIGQRMDLDERMVAGLRVGGLLHDVGKFGIPTYYLSKPGRLSALEYTVVRTHSEVGAEIVGDARFPWPLREMIYQHHERIDGTGYPAGLAGENIILEARIIAVADVIDAMAAHRPYRPAIGLNAARDEMLRWRGLHYDATVVDAALELLDDGYVFPPDL